MPDNRVRFIRHRDAESLYIDWSKATVRFPPETKPTSTRKASGAALNAIAATWPALVGGSADLAGSNVTPIKNGGELAIVYSWLSLYLAAQGPGAFALDGARSEDGLATAPGSTADLSAH